MLSILEDHTKPEPANAVTSLVVINAKTKTFETIAKGADFYASAKFSPDGKKVAWIQWHHPDMPWEGSELAIAEFYVDPAQESFKSVSGEKVVAGQPEKESTSQPNWLSDDKLLFLSDSSGFYNPHVYDFAKSSASPALASPLAQDFAEPAWLLGGSSLAVLTPTSVVVCPVENGTSYLAILDLKEGTINRLKTPYQTIGKLHACDSTHVVFTGLSDTESSSIIELALSPEPTYKTLKQSSTIAATLPEGSLSRSIPYELGTSDAPLYVTFYGPLHPEYRGLEKELPPAVISVHGGPTSRVPPGLAWTTQYFTSRGWAW